MAKNKNIDELNRLQDDGKIETPIVDAKKEVESAAKGEQTVDEVPQVVTIDVLKEYAFKNKVFSKLETHCNREGISVFEHFIKCFEDTSIKPSEMLDEINLRIPTLIKNINKDNTINLFFNGNGDVNVEKSIVKAEQNGMPVAQYVKVIAEESGKNVNGIDDVNDVLLSIERMNEYEEYRKDVFVALGKLNENEDFKKLKQSMKDIDNNKKTSNKIPEEQYIVAKILENIDVYLSNFKKPESISDENIMAIQCFAKLKVLTEIDRTKLPDFLLEQIDVRIELIKKTIVKTNAVDNMAEITPEKLESLLEKSVNVGVDDKGNPIKKKLREIYEDENNKLNTVLENAKNIYEETQLSEEELKNKLSQDYQEVVDGSNFKSCANLIRMIHFLPRIKAGEKIDLKEEDIDDPTFKFFRKDENNEKLLDESKEKFGIDDTVDIKVRTLKRIVFDEFFDNYEVNNQEILSYVKNPEDKEKALLIRECSLIRYAIEFAKQDEDKKVLGNSADDEMHGKAKNIIKEYLSSDVFKEDGNLDDKKLLEAFKEKYGSLKAMSKINTIDDLYKETNERTMNFLKSKIASEMLQKDRKKFYGESKIVDIINSQEFIEEVNSKCLKRRKIDFEHKMRENLIERFNSRLEDKKNNLVSDPAIELDLMKKSLIILGWRDIKGYNLDEHVVNSAKQNIAEKFPGCIRHGEIDYEMLNKEYKEYALQAYKAAELPSIKYTDNVIRDEFEDYEKAQKGWYDREGLRQNPEEWKKKNDEIRKEAKRKLKIVKCQEDMSVYEFIVAIKRGRAEKGENNIDIDSGKNIDELEKRVKKRLQNKIIDEDEYNTFINQCNTNEVDELAYFNLAKEAKLTMIRKDANDLLAQTINPKGEINQESLKRAFEYYIGIKRDLERSPVNDKDNKYKILRLNHIIKKTSPEIFIDGKVDDNLLLNKYNELFGTDIENVDEMYNKVEDKLLGQYVNKIVEAIDKGEGYRGDFAQPLVGRNFFRRVKESRNNGDELITDKETSKVFDVQAVEIVVDDLELINEDKNPIETPVEPDLITDEEAKKIIDANAVEIGEGETKPKTGEGREDDGAKVSQETGEKIVLETIETGEEIGTNLPAEVKNENPLSRIFNNVKAFFKEKIGNLKNTLFSSNNSGSNNASTSSSGGVSMADQTQDKDGVENLTGYGKFTLTFNTQDKTPESGDINAKDKSMQEEEVK